MILHGYFIRKFLGLFFGLLLLFFVFQALIDLIETVRRFQGANVTLWGLISLTLLNVPQGLYQIIPLVMILATVSLFLGLARSSELVVVRATGRSALGALIAPASMAFLIGVILVAMFNPIVAATTKRFHDKSQELRERQHRCALAVHRGALAAPRRRRGPDCNPCSLSQPRRDGPI